VTEPFRDNQAEGRFELEVEGGVVFATYRRDAANLAILHVEAPRALRGTGAAGRLMRAIVDQAALEGRAIQPYCGYAAAWLRRHGELSRRGSGAGR
jgi:uncharacterized protein